MPTRRLLPSIALAALVATAAVAARPRAAAATPPALAVTHAGASGSMPKGVTVSPDGTRLYVTNYGNLGVGNVVVFDAAGLRRLETINVPGIVVESVAAPDGRTLYVSNFARNSVQFLDLARRRVVREVRVGARPKILVLSRDGRRLFAANWGGHSVTEVDTASGRVVRTLRAGRNPRGMALTRHGRLYVANFNGASLDVYDGPTLEDHHRLENVCRIPRHLALSPDERRLYVSCLGENQVVALDTRSERVAHVVPVGLAPKAVDVSADGRYVFTANYGGSSVSVIDTSDWAATTLDVPAMDHASGVAAASGLRFFVTGWYDGHLFAVGPAGAGPRFEVSAAVQQLTLRRREYHRTHPVE